ncbi:MAG: hypothetical protein ACXAEU_17070 [Candidatus Hodarchaeales archaeon]|jgi:hypothetical protein
MSLQGLSNVNIPGASQAFNSFVGGVRLYMRDFAQLNRLVDGEESSDRMIAFAVLDALSEFQSVPPNLGIYSFETFLEKGWVHMLRIGTICKLLEMVGLLQTRNHLPFSDGGLNVAVSDKTPLIQSWLQIFGGRWQRWMEQVKVAENISNAINDNSSGVFSEYFAVNGYFAEVYW